MPRVRNSQLGYRNRVRPPAAAIVSRFLDAPRRLDHLVEQAAARAPLAVAAVCDDRALTYRELDERTNQIARVFRRYGVRPEACVAICADRSLETILGLIGIAKAGGAFVPLDSSFPDERLQSMVADVEPHVLVVDGPLRDRFTATSGVVLTLETLLREADDETTEPATWDRSQIDLAYVIFTSGSTGRPKGVMVEHRSVSNMLVSSIADFDLSPADRVLQLAPLSFDPSIWQIFGTLAAGGCIVIPPAGAERDVDAIVAAIRDHGVSVLIAVPALLALIVEREDLAGSNLRIAVSGGSVLTPALRDYFRERRLPLYNVYGPTEASIHATTHRCTDDDQRAFVPIGSPIARMHVYVLDARLLPVAPESIGEIYLGGIGVARGYLNRDDLTSAHFVRDPFIGGGARMYRTGDLGRLHPDGAIEFAGRADDQVKVRGVRIELNEIIAALERQPQVAAATVTAANDRIHAYVVPRETAAPPTGAALQAHARTLLPPAAVPATFTVIDALPLLPSGKVNRAQLPAPAPVASPNGASERPHDPLAAAVYDLWEELLGTGAIGTQQRFFDAGGDSLLAARFLARLEKRIGRHVPLPVFFENPTIDGVAAALTAAEHRTFESIVALETGGSRTPFFYLHGDVNGLGNYSRSFGEVLGPDRPVYTIAPHGLDGGAVPPTIEAMAEDYVQAILAIDPNGPYALGGFCIGGIVAFEVARQLERRGKTVAHVTLIEAQRSRHHFAKLVERPVMWMAAAARIEEDRTRDGVARLRGAYRRISDRVMPWRTTEQLVEAEFPKDIERIVAAQDNAVRHYVWQPIRASATMLYTRDNADMTAVQVRATWSHLFSSLDVHSVPGDHQTALVRHIDALARALARALERAGT
jgi:amino acid adenylation domain-containing protein